jgi:hypothetical protein
MDILWQILNSIRGESEPDLDTSIKILADSEKSKVKSFFETTLDQPSFGTDDYKRLRSFLIDLFSSHRTITTIQKQISDVFSIPSSSLDELIKSFGYAVALDKLDDVTKATFFLDLVNLYKLKGTPSGLVQALNYYGLTNIEFVEYWLMKNNIGQLVFKGINVLEENKLVIPWSDIPYDIMIISDPHWLLTKDKAEASILTNSIALPSKSPYIGIRPRSKLTDVELISIILSWKVQNDFTTWKSSGVKPTKDINLGILNYLVSFLELYISCIYSINTQYQITTGNTVDPFLCYDGTASITIEQIIQEYTDFLETRPTSRSDRDQKILSFIDIFTRPISEKFVDSTAEVELYLTQLDPDLKDLLDVWLNTGHGDDLIVGLMNELATWISINIGAEYTNISAFMFGIGSLGYIRSVIEFFKPYRARIKDLEHAYTIDDPNKDSVMVDDLAPGQGNNPITEIQQFYDWDTANSEPGWLENWLPGGFITSTPLAGEYLITNIYVDPYDVAEAVNQLVPVDSTASYIISQPAVGQYRVTNIYLIDVSGMKKLVVDYEDYTTTTPGISSLIRSTPPYGAYRVIDLKRDSIGRYIIEYDTTASAFPWGNEGRDYYSRETYDCGSYFDIGAAYDIDKRDPFGPSWLEIYYEDSEHDHLNTHPNNYPADTPYYGTEIDSTAYTGIRFVEGLIPDPPVPGPEVIEVMTFGGFVDMDCGWTFDAPFVSDVCMITVQHA